MREITFAATQMACSNNSKDNIDNAVSLIEQAAKKGANVVLIQELFEHQYFCKDQKEEFFKLAVPFKDNPTINLMSKVAKENNVVLPISFFEKANKAYFNSAAMIDSDGTILGKYRKSHIPDGPGYQEKFYFNPGNTGFKVWDTKFCKIGLGICWDQWFPEAARIMALQGAEVLLYPTAIGGEPDNDEDFDSSDMWQKAMIGHSATNQIPVVASNRIGTEKGLEITNFFYGRSFVADYTGNIIAEGSRDKEEILLATIDLDKAESLRNVWGIFRDRRTDLYQTLLDLDGSE
ncbi:MAG: N-carbamoylputrescine amidase [Candidatus Pelagibacterales bacterium]|jgi:N-carbamoylputrescine amidase|tara:strand:- start:314 stop:1186 length:873 start_codon:yes stop_codon:yes gene_type:complete